MIFILSTILFSLSPYLGIVVFNRLIIFYLRKRRKDKFNGNFEPAIAKNVGRASGMGLMGDSEVDEDDGMRGMLGAGPEGVITPYPFQPAPIGGTAVGGQHQPQMWQTSNTALAADGVGARLAAGHPNGKRAGQQIHDLHTSNPSLSNPNQQDHFVLSPSSGGGNTNETETMGEDIFNPYLLTGPERHEPPSCQHQQHLSTTSPTAVPPQPPRAGAAVVVHEDGAQVVLCKGDSEEGEGEIDWEVLNSESPPYDSLPLDVRRDG